MSNLTASLSTKSLKLLYASHGTALGRLFWSHVLGMQQPAPLKHLFQFYKKHNYVYTCLCISSTNSWGYEGLVSFTPVKCSGTGRDTELPEAGMMGLSHVCISAPAASSPSCIGFQHFLPNTVGMAPSHVFPVMHLLLHAHL